MQPPHAELIQSDGDPAADRFIRQLSDFIAARDVYVHGLVAEAEGNTPRAVDAFVESARISPDFSTGYAHCLTIAMQESKSNPLAARVLLQRLSRRSRHGRLRRNCSNVCQKQ